MSDLARVETERQGSFCFVRLYGEVDISNVQEVSVAIEGVPANATSGVIVDLTNTAYLDSAGVGLLVRLAERLRGRRQKFGLLVPADSPVRAVLELTGLQRVMPLHFSLEEALGQSGNGPRPGPPDNS
jgi:anti-sigma B factor antagonist